MVKRTLYFGNSAYLHTRNEQLVIELPNAQGLDYLTKMNTIPIEDIGIVILDHSQITITHSLLSKLLANNVAVITSNEQHLPQGLLLNLDGHTLQSARFKAQIEATEPLKKQLWQQTVKAKIENQALLLDKLGLPSEPLWHFAQEVKSGDIENREARAATHYWKTIFKAQVPDFKREREGVPPNHLLNYGYAIVRAIVARALVGSGLLPTLGIFHKSQYNAYCLADDIMEPYRPMVDELVVKMVLAGDHEAELDKQSKAKLLILPMLDVRLQKDLSPMSVAIHRTTTSLAACFEGKQKKILYATLEK